ncbi:MAG: stage IV sporulation protein A [Clostridia bacterium]|nr:stage IV sporulation protein A [Clostridia bacterium]MBQ1963026.1 stage IV sporulation protein A [Clostridia bacterium]
MPEHSIYKDIAERTGGDIYVGVVGPVRSGKSTFIKRFMEAVVLPNIGEGYSKDRARDELPQSAAGKTVMTTEPKFIPEEAVPVRLEENAEMRVRMIDCVGYLIPEAMGAIEDGQPRMVRTPWRQEPIPFAEAAEMGTHKVISEHSTIGMVVTTDGSIGEIPRSAYVEAEERVVKELRELGKPFAVILNSAHPESDASRRLAMELEEAYGVPVALVSCLDLDAEDIHHILGMILEEFPVSEVVIKLPKWMTALPPSHRIASAVRASVKRCAEQVKRIGDVRRAFSEMKENEYVCALSIERIDLGSGCAELTLHMKEELYYGVIGELTGFDVAGERELIALLQELSRVKKDYDKISEALAQVRETGYGIVMPEVEDLRLEEPQIVKQAGGYGVKLRAGAQSVHMIRANIEAEIHPMVGTEQQSEDLVRYMLKEFEEDPKSIWSSKMFGKSLYELINEGLHTKLEHMPEESRQKLSETLERIINEGSNGLICILL